MFVVLAVLLVVLILNGVIFARKYVRNRQRKKALDTHLTNNPMGHVLDKEGHAHILHPDGHHSSEQSGHHHFRRF